TFTNMSEVDRQTKFKRSQQSTNVNNNLQSQVHTDILLKTRANITNYKFVSERYVTEAAKGKWTRAPNFQRYFGQCKCLRQ
ncbi:MAG TPA: hypothetical protein VGO47_05235, partial [Chlamydiales bacterium]|nr:hypothetical protein [Chlamydiales bacterium]